MPSKYPVSLFLNDPLDPVKTSACFFPAHLRLCFRCAGGQCERTQVACDSPPDLQDWLDLLTKHTHAPAAPTHSHKPQPVCHTVRTRVVFFLNNESAFVSVALRPPPPSPLPPPVALSPCHSLQSLGVSRGERRTLLPHPSPPLLLWDGPQQRPNVGAPGAAEHPQTLEPELPPPGASTPALSCSLPERGAKKINFIFNVALDSGIW